MGAKDPRQDHLPPILAAAPGWLVLDKPPGLAVHPGPRTPHSLEALLPQLAVHGQVPRPVHRLDRDTSGCLLLSRRASAHRRLAAAFAAGSVTKCYWALVEGPFEGDQGRIVAPLLKQSQAGTGWRMLPSPSGQAAATRWLRLADIGPQALVAFFPETGRTHQIRVHATLMGERTAVVGDPVYGRGGQAGMMLHARALGFQEPQTGEAVEVVAPAPARFALSAEVVEAAEARLRAVSAGLG
jgi:tRNA pseudouridine32 synthase/23S rRNA pseudouridine746 synthase